MHLPLVAGVFILISEIVNCLIEPETVTVPACSVYHMLYNCPVLFNLNVDKFIENIQD